MLAGSALFLLLPRPAASHLDRRAPPRRGPTPGYMRIPGTRLDRDDLAAQLPAGFPRWRALALETFDSPSRRRAVLSAALLEPDDGDPAERVRALVTALAARTSLDVVAVELYGSAVLTQRSARVFAEPLATAVLAEDGRGWGGTDAEGRLLWWTGGAPGAPAQLERQGNDGAPTAPRGRLDSPSAGA